MRGLTFAKYMVAEERTDMQLGDQHVSWRQRAGGCRVHPAVHLTIRRRISSAAEEPMLCLQARGHAVYRDGRRFAGDDPLPYITVCGGGCRGPACTSTTEDAGLDHRPSAGCSRTVPPSCTVDP